MKEKKEKLKYRKKGWYLFKLLNRSKFISNSLTLKIKKKKLLKKNI
jgi:hypothetical protein